MEGGRGAACWRAAQGGWVHVAGIKPDRMELGQLKFCKLEFLGIWGAPGEGKIGCTVADDDVPTVCAAVSPAATPSAQG